MSAPGNAPKPETALSTKFSLPGCNQTNNALVSIKFRFQNKKGIMEEHSYERCIYELVEYSSLSLTTSRMSKEKLICIYIVKMCVPFRF